MATNYIYEIFQLFGVIFKYCGYIPLPGLYEPKTSKKWKIWMLSKIPQMFSFVTCMSFAFTVFAVRDGKKREYNFSDWLIYALNTLIFLAIFIPPIMSHLRVSKRLLILLKLHANVESLLKPRKGQLKTSVNAIIVVFTTLVVFKFGWLTYIRYCISAINLSDAHDILFVLLDFHVFFNGSLNPNLLYVIFQYVLRNLFDELNFQVRRIKLKNKSDCAQSLENYRKMHGVLCQMSKILNETVNPTLAFQYLLGFVEIVYYGSFITLPLDTDAIVKLIFIAYHWMSIISDSTMSYSTTKSASTVMVNAFNAFDLNNKKIKYQFTDYVMQNMYQSCTFSASGLFKIDRSLILSIFHSIFSYWLVFFKIHNNMK